MVVGLLTIDLFIPGAQSLKEKRSDKRAKKKHGGLGTA